MNLFSTLPYLQALNEAYFPNEKLAFEDFKINDKIWRLPVQPNGKPITQWPFLDFFEPLETAKPSLSEKKVYIYRASLDKVSATEWFEAKLENAYKAAPTIDWSMFPEWSDFESYVASRNSQHFPGTEKLKRKLSRSLGPVTYLRHDPKPETLQACLDWKSAQFPMIKPTLDDPRTKVFFNHLIANGLVMVSSLSAGETLLAANVCAYENKRFYSWISSYNFEHSKYGTGRVLLDYLLRESHANGDTEYDFLLGNEAYKWTYSTHSRLIGEVAGLMPITKTWVKEKLLAHPEALQKIKQLKSKFTSDLPT
jgi:hypothetical protein